jgi:hypothetical protein
VLHRGADRAVPKLSRNDREVDHGKEAEEVEDEGEEGEARLLGAQEEESSEEEERSQEAGCEESEEEGQEEVSAQEVEAEGSGSGPRACTGFRTGADARDGSAVHGGHRHRRLIPRLRAATTKPSAAVAAGGFCFQA